MNIQKQSKSCKNEQTRFEEKYKKKFKSLMRSKRSLPIGKRNLRVELEATSEGNRTATIAIDVSTSNIILNLK